MERRVRALEHHRVRNAGKSVRTRVDDDAAAELAHERAVAVTDDDRARARREARGPIRGERGVAHPVAEHRQHAVRPHGHVRKRRDMRARAHHAPLCDRRLARGGEQRLVLGRSRRRARERVRKGRAHRRAERRPRRDRWMERVAMRDVDRAVGDRERALLADERIVVARDEVELHAARGAEVAEEVELALRVGLEARVVQLGDVAVDDDAVGLGDDLLERIRAECAARSAEMQVAQHHRARKRLRGVRSGTWLGVPVHGRAVGARIEARRPSIGDIRAEDERMVRSPAIAGPDRR